MEMTRIYRDGERCRVYLRADQIVRIEPNRREGFDAGAWVTDNLGVNFPVLEDVNDLIVARDDEATAAEVGLARA